MMIDGAQWSHSGSSDDSADQWLIDVARNAGHAVPRRERAPGTTAWRALLNAGIAEDEVLRLACAGSGAAPADFTSPSPTMRELMPHALAIKLRVVPVGTKGGVALVATSNPNDVQLERELHRALNRHVQLQAGSPSDIIRAQAAVYGDMFGPPVDPPRAPSREPTLAALGQDKERTPQAISASVPRSAPRATTRDETLADRLIAAAISDLASEVVLEPERDGGLLVRMRIDGVVHDRLRVAADRTAELIESLRRSSDAPLGSDRKIADPVVFQSSDGPVTVRVRSERMRDAGDGSVETARDRLVLQLRYARGLVGIADLGYSESEQRRLRLLLGESGGLVVVAGPTGAGKTATLYAAARELSWWGRLVSTVEQTIEYPLSGITQLSLSTGRRLGLAEAIRAAGGMTTDIVASAVIADAPLDATTFESCASAASRGQLVLATLVAPDLRTTFAHLRALHPDGEPVAASLRGVVVQRLLRRLCDTCAAPQREADLPELERSLLARVPGANARRPVGCDACLGTGYRGRLAIVEIVPVTAPLRHAIARRAVATELMYVMREQQFPTLWDSGLAHVRAGTTSLAELLDAVSPPQDGVAHEDFDEMLSDVLKPARPRQGKRDD